VRGQTDPTADLAEVGYAAVLVTEQIGPLLSEAVVRELTSLLPGGPHTALDERDPD
jgi:hypothetical protein